MRHQRYDQIKNLKFILTTITLEYFFVVTLLTLLVAPYEITAFTLRALDNLWKIFTSLRFCWKKKITTFTTNPTFTTTFTTNPFFINDLIHLFILCTHDQANPANIDLFKANYRNTRKRCEISSGVFMVNFQHISYLFLEFLLLTLNKWMFAGILFFAIKFLTNRFLL